MHLRTSANPGLVGANVRIGFEINSDEVRPVYYGECIGVGDREVAAHKVLAVCKLVVDVGQPLIDIGLRRILDLLRRGLIEEGSEALVEVGADKGKPLLEPIALDSSSLRR